MLTAIQDLINWAPVGIPAFIFVIAMVVFFHELGHFLMARACNVSVETFSIGFGGEIFGWTDRKATHWKVCWLPLGGYVKFTGDENAASIPDRERMANMGEDEKKNAFPFKPLWQRMLVVAAGPLANFVLAFVVFVVLFGGFGARALSTYVGAVQNKSPAAVAGLKPGDKITAVDGRTVQLYMPVVQELVRSSEGKNLTALQDLIRSSGGKTLTLTVLRGDKTLLLHVTPRVINANNIYGENTKIMAIGILPADPSPANTVNIPIRLVKVPQLAASECWRIVDTSLTYLWRIVSHRADASQLGGPIGMAQMAKSAASHGFYDLIYLVAFISVSIGMINLFPIPLLDGGHLLYYACEGVLGRPLDERTQDVGFRLGLALVIGLMIFATWNDLVR
jgi:regulator of sigma E protease